MIAPLLGYFFCMISVLTAVAAVLTGFANISPSRRETHHLRPPVMDRTATVEIQRHSPVGKEQAPAKTVSKDALPAKDVSPATATATAEADAKKSKHYKSKVVARQHNNYGYGSWLGYAQESRYAPKGPFFQ
jgi:hypothetical protein